MKLGLRCSARSDVGKVRQGNEDSGFANSRLLVVADGMGGHAAGELASSTAIATLADPQLLSSTDHAEALRDAVALAEERITDTMKDDPTTGGMGTTLTALMWVEPQIIVTHVGDSRAYRLRNGQLTQLTRDHTYVQSLVDAGELTAEDARHHPRRNLLTKAIDGIHAVEPDIYFYAASEGDRFLLCSDGLCGVVEESEICRILISATDLALASEQLVDAALHAGAPDNVTVIVADLVGLDAVDDLSLDLMSSATVVGAAHEARNRKRLPGLVFPDDVDNDVDITSPHGIRTIATVDETEPRDTSTSAGTQPPGPTSQDDPSPTTTAPTQSRRRIPALAMVVAGAVAFALIAVISMVTWISGKWYVGVNGTGLVTIYQGIPQHLFGIQLARQSDITDVSAASLALFRQASLYDGFVASNEERAQQIVAQLRIEAAQCEQIPTPAGCPGAPVDPSDLTDDTTQSPTASSVPTLSPDARESSESPAASARPSP